LIAVERRRLGRTDMEVSVLGFGGAEIGYDRVAPAMVERLLTGALAAGLNVIDTAECYLEGESLIGRAIASRRRDVWLFTKCGHMHGYLREDWRPASLMQSMERSLERLRTDHVDLIQLHSCDEHELRRGGVIEALERMRERGMARYIGYSGDGDAASHAVQCGRFDTLQISVSIADQEAIETALPAARARGMGVIAKRPIANAAWRTGKKPAEPYHHEYWRRLKALEYDFLRGDSRAVIATALRFTLSVPGVHTAIVGTTKPGRWADNAALLAPGPLPTAEYEAIRARWRAVALPDWTGER